MTSSPGANDISYGCYNACADLAAPLYDEFISLLFNGCQPDVEFNDARVAVIDELAQKNIAPGTGASKGGRYLTISNVEARNIAAMLASPRNAAADSMILEIREDISKVKMLIAMLTKSKLKR